MKRHYLPLSGTLGAPPIFTGIFVSNAKCEVQLPSPNGFLGHTRGQVNCAMARSKALINAGMPVYFVWNRKSHIANGTAKSVGSHNVSNSESGGVSVEDCDPTEVPGPETASKALN